MKTADFDYDLSPERIAQIPAEPRDASRLMILGRSKRTIQHRAFRDLADFLVPGDTLVCNESRVIPARIFGKRVPTGGRVEALLIAKRGERIWETLVKPGRRIREGDEIEVSAAESPPTAASLLEESRTARRPSLLAKVVGRTESGGRLLEFEERPDLESTLERLGVVPLPPYVHAQLDNPERYQTVYARVRGSVAAPTAGLHFTPELIDRLQTKGIQLQFVTLHIGLDTFRPVQEEEIQEHRMHSEHCELCDEVAEHLNRAKADGRRIVAVGTTTVRVLESAARTAATSNGSTSRGHFAGFKPYSGWTNMFIYPGYAFKGTDAIITNFHLPRSTLLMLVSAFADYAFIRRAYAEAIDQGYRFYSFGDAMLIA